PSLFLTLSISAMQLPTELTFADITTFKKIVTDHKIIGYIAPHIKQLYEKDESWKSILSNKKHCEQLVTTFNFYSNNPKTPKEITARFIGTPGMIKYAKKIIKKNPLAQQSLNNMLVDTGLWVYKDNHWENQAIDVARAILQTTNSPDHIFQGKTALINASITGNVPVIQLLLQHGASINLQDPKISTTALIEATRHGHAQIVGLLLNAGADISLHDENNETTSTIFNKSLEQQLNYKLIGNLLSLPQNTK